MGRPPLRGARWRRVDFSRAATKSGVASGRAVWVHTATTWAVPCFARCSKHGHQERWYPSDFSVVPFGFAQGRLWPQKARRGWGTRRPAGAEARFWSGCFTRR